MAPQVTAAGGDEGAATERGRAALVCVWRGRSQRRRRRARAALLVRAARLIYVLSSRPNFRDATANVVVTAVC